MREAASAPETTREAVLRLTKAKLKPREVAYITRVSVQMVHKHLRNLRRDGLLPEEEAS